MNDRPWLSAYPEGVPADMDVQGYRSLVDLMQESFGRHANRTAYSFLGRKLSFGELDQRSRQLAAYLQSLGLVRGDRVAIMLPNVLQYPLAVAAVLRAGFVVVNVNPLYTSRELEYQLKDSGARAIVIIENFGSVLQKCLANTSVQHVVLCTMGDQLSWLKGTLVNHVVRKIKKLVPAFELPLAIRFNEALSRGAHMTLKTPDIGPDDVAVLQYTGGTTGVSKGAVLLHRNLLANVLQSEAWNQPVMQRVPAHEQPTSVCALPLYHIFAFTVNMMLSMRTGGMNILIPNPRDIPAVLKELSQHTFHIFPAVNTLFNALLSHPDFASVNWSNLKISLGGGTAVQSAVAQRWLEKTGCPICEGYGLSETSPSASCNPTTSSEFTGTIGVPLPSTRMKIVDDEGVDVLVGQAGEIVIQGPQVMAGYWQRPDETARVMMADGWFRSGDVGIMDERGYFRIVDRKKDMILVSGFNVYPNEVEEVVAQLPGVLECAVIGVPDDKSGEAVKLVVVRKDPGLTEERIREHCKSQLTGYKQPRVIEFRSDLPKTPVGKILRRELRSRPEGGTLTDSRMTLGIVSAMHEELSAVLTCFDAQPVELAGRTYWCGDWSGLPVVAVLSRIGKVAAATTATTLIHRFQVSQIVMTGVAGGLAPPVHVGDAVVAQSFLQHDFDASPLFPRYEVPLYGRSHFGVDDRLSALLREAAHEALTTPEMVATLAEVLSGSMGHEPGRGFARSPQVHQGLVVSGDRFVSSSHESLLLQQQLPAALAVEMEGAAMAQVCHDHDLPFAGVRLISDRADDAAHVDFRRFIRAVAAPGSAAVMQALVRRLT